MSDLGQHSIEADRAAGTLFPFIDRTYRRRISLHPSPGVVEAEMEDYIHHFAVRIEHEDGIVTAAEAMGIRHPWDACPIGARGVTRLVGTPLVEASSTTGWAEDRSRHCVHLVDLAMVAARHALDAGPTELEVRIPNASQPQRIATLRRNGAVVFAWTIDGDAVVAPDRFAGMSLSGSAFFRWVRDHLADDDEVEAAVVLRRACHIGTSRGMDLDRYAVAADAGSINGSCYVYQPRVAVRARRMVGTARPTEDD